jgi:molecular chaperone HtpG
MIETRAFQAETKQLLDLVVNSLYSHKEIFLRELISNASDALDRLRFEALTRPDLVAEGTVLEIRLESGERTLSVHDNGIGMSREELIENIGTIARSGTRGVWERIKDSKAENLPELIGQFGVGFYSAFMVSDRVTLVTRRAGETTATRWESAGDGQYTLDDTERPAAGTSVTLHLRPADPEGGLEDYTQSSVLEDLVKRYSDFVRYPIFLGAAPEDKPLNSMKAIWLKRKGEVTEAEQHELYRHISHDWKDPQKTITVHAEGTLEYHAILFIPSKAPFDLQFRQHTSGLKLYVKNVKIMDECAELLPSYLRFMKGVVDSPDLPLNVSREILQQDRQLKLVRKGLTKKVLDTLSDLLAKERGAYEAFWREFGGTLKEAVATGAEEQDKITPLLLCPSSHDPEAPTTLAEYVGRMKEGQDAIYYLTGESRKVVESSPVLEAFQGKGIEVLYLVDPIDEVMVQFLTEAAGKKLKSASKGTIELGTKEEKEKVLEDRKEKEKEFTALIEYLQKELTEQVKEVRLSNRLTSSPACLVSADNDLSPQLERLLGHQKGPASRRILELNAAHPICTSMRDRLAAGEEPALSDHAHLLLGVSLLAEGSSLADPGRFTQLVAKVMTRAGI